MSVYVDRVPGYRYFLPCGFVFRTTFKSVSDESPMRWHWFPCRRCDKAHAIKERDLQFTAPPRGSNAYDEAIIKDRIHRDLQASWGSEPAEVIAKRHGVSVKTVYRVGAALGVWR